MHRLSSANKVIAAQFSHHLTGAGNRMRIAGAHRCHLHRLPLIDVLWALDDVEVGGAFQLPEIGGNPYSSCLQFRRDITKQSSPQGVVFLNSLICTAMSNSHRQPRFSERPLLVRSAGLR